MTFNPNAASVFGVEWPVTREGGVMLSAANDTAVAGFTAGASETVTAVPVYLSRVTGAPSFELVVDELADIPVTVTTDVFRPNEDVVDENIVGVPVDTAGSLYTNIDEATLDAGDFVEQDVGGTPTSFDFRVASGAATTPFVLAVRVKAVVANDAPPTAAVNEIEVGLVLGGTDYYRTAHAIAKADGTVTIEEEWITNPSTGDRWTQAEVRAFDTTDEVSLRWNASALGVQVFQAWMEVDHRPAPAGVGNVSPTADGWASVTLDASWSKTATTAYVVALRKTNAGGNAAWNLLDSTEACPHVSHVSYRPTVDVDTGLISALGDAQAGAHALTFTVAGAASADSQPYATMTAEPVYTGRSVQQEFTAGSNVTIGNLAGVIARQAATVDGDLLVKLHRRSDDSQVGGTVTITSDDVADSVRMLRQHVAAMASTGAIFSGTQYYIEFSSTATSGTGWKVAVLSSESAAGNATFGGTTNAATVAGTESTTKDAPAFGAVAPATISGVSATESGTGANVGVLVSWTASVDANFEAYEIYRGGTKIAEVATKATESFIDYEARAAVEESYTVVQRSTLGLVSAASAAAVATIARPAMVRFTSNHDASLNISVWLEDFARQRFEDRSEYEPLGTDHVRVHRGRQERGAAWSLTVRCGVDGSVEGDEMFAAVLALARAAVPYVTLLQPWGDRHFVTLEFVGDAMLVPSFGDATVRARTVTPSFVAVA